MVVISSEFFRKTKYRRFALCYTFRFIGTWYLFNNYSMNLRFLRGDNYHFIEIESE